MTPQVKKRIEQIRRGEVPEGYKKTKVGIVPEKWEESTLSDYLFVNSEKNGDLRYGKEDVFSISGDLGIVNQIDLLGRSYAGASVAPYGVVYPNDVVYTKSPLKANPYGIIKTNLTEKVGIVSTLYAIFHCKNNVCPKFVQDYFSWNHRLNNYLFPIVNIGAKHDMKISDENSLKGVVVFPPLAEQEKIAEILTAQDKLIETQQKKIDELKRLKKVCLSKMFPKKGCNVPEVRFPGFTEPWEQCKVGDALTESREIGHSGNIAKKITVKLWGKGVYAKNDKGSAATQYFTRHAGQFIYSKLDFLNSAFGVVPKELESYESTVDLPAFDCVGVNPYFMFYRAIQPSFYLTNGMIADGSRKAKRIHVETFLDMPLDLPSTEEQKQIADFFTHLDHLITLHQRKLEEEQKKKKALMQLLLTGIVRVTPFKGVRKEK